MQDKLFCEFQRNSIDEATTVAATTEGSELPSPFQTSSDSTVLPALEDTRQEVIPVDQDASASTDQGQIFGADEGENDVQIISQDDGSEEEEFDPVDLILPPFLPAFG